MYVGQLYLRVFVEEKARAGGVIRKKIGSEG